MACVDYVYVYPSTSSLRRVKIPRRDLPEGSVVIGASSDGASHSVLVYAAPDGAESAVLAAALPVAEAAAVEAATAGDPEPVTVAPMTAMLGARVPSHPRRRGWGPMRKAG